MNFSVQPNTRIFIIEGIAGAGKNTLHQQLREQLKEKVMYEFFEEELLFSWKHAWVENIDQMRLVFFTNFLQYCKTILESNDKAVFILNRFHISYKIFALDTTEEVTAMYQNIIETLSQLPVEVYICTVSEALIEQRSAHSERLDLTWKIHLQKRLEQKGFMTLTQMYSQEQKNIIQIGEMQNIPYQIIDMSLLTL